MNSVTNKGINQCLKLNQGKPKKIYLKLSNYISFNGSYRYKWVCGAGEELTL